MITEDSDLIAFGVRRILFKMGTDGHGKRVDMDKLEKIEGEVDFTVMTHE